MSPDVSVVIPTLGRPTVLGEALASVLSQTGASLEVLVVDDSREGLAEAVVTGLRDARVQYLRTAHPGSGRLGQVRNEGWPRARGRFIHFLDDGDVVPADHYAQALKEFEANPRAGVLFGRVEPFGDPDHLAHERAFFKSAALRAAWGQRLGRRVLAARQLLEPSMLVCSAGLTRSEVPRRLGGFDPAIRLVEDVDFYARAFRQFGAHFVDRVFLRHRVGPSPMHTRTSDALIAKGYRRMHEKYAVTHGSAELTALKVVVRGLERLT